jgi:hypothetical protein
VVCHGLLHTTITGDVRLTKAKSRSVPIQPLIDKTLAEKTDAGLGPGFALVDTSLSTIPLIAITADI